MPGTSAESSGDAGSGTYLALGDSVPFGFRGGAITGFSDAANFAGYPELVGAELGLEVVNASCPGETTASFLDTTAQSNGCQNSLQSGFGYRTAYPLHVRYESVDQSQLDFALDALTENGDVELVTLQLGANDGFLCQQTTANRCSTPEELAGVIRTVRANLGTILSTLRDGGGYEGQIVVVTYYALDYANAQGSATAELDAAIGEVAEANGADVANGYEAFESEARQAGGDSVAAGLVLPNDVHPTEEGQRLLAEAVLEVVDD
ncbi:SGNH/GDSL hydrolase family protein [Blastococcus deserti]|uniref:SGNH/GDSL hydrolase family protein n=1 Tax=Blastococcus deserti TaxID=2259033 RepID=A0ABW4XGK9_9ACTN